MCINYPRAFGVISTCHSVCDEPSTCAELRFMGSMKTTCHVRCLYGLRLKFWKRNSMIRKVTGCTLNLQWICETILPMLCTETVLVRNSQMLQCSGKELRPKIEANINNSMWPRVVVVNIAQQGLGVRLVVFSLHWLRQWTRVRLWYVTIRLPYSEGHRIVSKVRFCTNCGRYVVYHMNRPIANPFVHIENLEIFYAPDQIKNHKTVQVGGTNLYYILVRVSRSATYFMYVLHLEHNGPVNSLWHANSSSLRLAVKSYCARCLLNANNKYAHGTYSLHKLWSHELGHCFWYQTFVNCCRQLSPHVWLSLLRETLARGSWWDTKRNWDFGFTSQNGTMQLLHIIAQPRWSGAQTFRVLHSGWAF